MAKTKTKEEETIVPAVAPQEVPEEKLTAKDQKQVRIIEKIIESKEIAPQDAFGKMTRSQVELIKRTVARGASDDELKLFIQVCKGAKLNPFMRQVHLVPRWDSKIGGEVRTIQVGIDGFRAIAEDSGAYAGNDDPVFDGEKDIEAPDGKDKTKKLAVPIEAKVVVRKVVQGQVYDFSATARWDEYYPGPKLGFQWHIRPKLMLGKCAEALALRKAFPKLLSGMYVQEEMDRTLPAEAENQKVQKGFSMLMATIKKSSATELKDYIAKMEKSDKYTADQKDEFITLAEHRIIELEVKPQQ